MTDRIPDRSLRIIGGNWRGRKITFADRDEIRPTPDRVRETLFNWLQSNIAGSRCLELYAGSGILSMEALSRGAQHVTVVEKDPDTVALLLETLSRLCPDSNRYACFTMTARDWLRKHSAPPEFDVVFLDPPFDSEELTQTVRLLLEGHFLAQEGFLYLETPTPVAAGDLPPGLSIHRQKKAGQVHYCLCVRDR
jgi:16S rRNA (guanine966-N2)-methyltransferase